MLDSLKCLTDNLDLDEGLQGKKSSTTSSKREWKSCGKKKIRLSLQHSQKITAEKKKGHSNLFYIMKVKNLWLFFL